MSIEQERARQQWYERGRQDASTRTLLDEVERQALADSDPEHLAAYDAGAGGGPRPPISAEYVIEEISRKAGGMLSRGAAPQVVRLGRAQAAALQQEGHTEDMLTVPAAQSGHVSLLIEHTADEALLEVR